MKKSKKNKEQTAKFTIMHDVDDVRNQSLNSCTPNTLYDFIERLLFLESELKKGK